MVGRHGGFTPQVCTDCHSIIGFDLSRKLSEMDDPMLEDGDDDSKQAEAASLQQFIQDVESAARKVIQPG